MTDSIYWIWLQLMFGIGSRRTELMMNYFPDPQEIVEGIARNDRSVGMLTAQELKQSQAALRHAKEIQLRTEKKGCQIITPDHADYPPLLQAIYSKPAVLYVKGDLSCAKQALCIAMVGTRNLTEYGAKAAGMLAGDLARQGVVVVSGLADGIDTECHRAALDRGGRTVGVLGCGIDIPYPKNSRELKGRMSRSGAVITEYPLGTEPRAGYFPIRNRIISGICRGTVVVEADIKSGSLLTANHALDQGRDVFAVPGSIFSAREQGTHLLLKDGAKLAETVWDILEEYPGNWKKPRNPAPHPREQVAVQMAPIPEKQLPLEPKPLPAGVSAEAKELYGLFENRTATAEELAEHSGMEMGAVHTALTELELYDLIEGYPGRQFGLK